MKKRLIKTSNWIYGALISLLGFSQGCSITGPLMYGPPPPLNSAAVSIKGMVTNKADKPINNITVIITGGDQSPFVTNTDKNGEYSVWATSESIDTKYNLMFRDDDGSENGGEFSSVTQDVTFKGEDFSPDQKYLKGYAVKTINTPMEEKTN